MKPSSITNCNLPSAAVIVFLLILTMTEMDRSAEAAPNCSGAVIADKAGKALIAAAQAGSVKGFSDALQTYTDMNAIAVFALGRHRKSLPDARLKEFVEGTTSYVSRKLDGWRLKFRANAQIGLDCRSDKVFGQLEFLGGKPKQKIIWRFKGDRVMDVNVQNVWLSQLLREHFDKIMAEAKGDIEALFAELRK